MNYQRVLTGVLVITLLLYISISFLTTNTHSILSPVNPLDGCTFVYLDMGTNVGVQIRSTQHRNQSLEIQHYRKLYQPSQFPDAKVLPVFERYFGKPEERNYSEV